MIPKVIHYCWFGRNPKPEVVQTCIESWKKYCPDYRIIEWNEDNFDVNALPYTQAAYADRKWAFVSDYARLRVIFEEGGVYLDTDVLLYKNLDQLLCYDCFLASDDVRSINTGLGFGAEKGNPLIGAMMKAYEGYEYPSGTNVSRDTKIAEGELPGWEKSDQNITIGNTLIIGLHGYGEYAKHLYTYSWADEETQQERMREIEENKRGTLKVRIMWKIKCLVRNPRLIRFFDKRKGSRIERLYTFIAYDLLECGVWYFVKRLFRKNFSVGR